MFAKSFIFLSIVISSVGIQAQSLVKQSDITAILDHHNNVRKEVNTKPLVWSNSLAAYAQKWAEHLASKGSRIFHSECVHPDGRILGENIFWGSSFESFSLLDACESWYVEKNQYTYGTVGDANWHGVGHYTQMVWKTTREVGVGVARTKSGGIIVVASYYPAGNMVGDYPY